MLNWVAGNVRARILVERRQLGQRPVADHHAGGVGRGVAVQPLQLQRRVQQVGAPTPRRARASCRRGSISMAWARVTGLAGLAGTILASRSTWPSGSCSTRPTSRSTARACRVPKVMIWATRSRAVVLLDVGDHLLAPLLAEVDVEVGHGHPLGVQEPLEQQAEPQRVQVGDGQRPGDQRAGARAPARPHGNAVRLGPFDEVRHDQEVAGEAHLLDDRRSPAPAGPSSPPPGAAGAGPCQPRLQALARLVGQFLGLGAARAGVEARQDRARASAP